MTTTFINRMGTAGILLAVATYCGAPEASVQLFLNIGGPGAQRSPGITDNLGLGGPGSATAVQGLNEPVIGSNRGISLPSLTTNFVALTAPTIGEMQKLAAVTLPTARVKWLIRSYTLPAMTAEYSSASAATKRPFGC